MRYRRAWMPGGAFFFTVNLLDRTDDLLVRHIDQLRHAFQHVRSRHPFRIDAIVILPDHLHAIWTLSENDTNFSTRWSLIKASFSRAIPRHEEVSGSRISKGERGVWQRRFWEHRIRDDADMRRHVDYIHWNPVKHGYVRRPAACPHSSFHRYVQGGVVAGRLGRSVGVSRDGIRRAERLNVGVRYAHPNLRSLIPFFITNGE